MQKLSVLATEYVLIPVTETEQGTGVDPTTQVVQVAATAPSTAPIEDDWHNGDWEADVTDADNPVYSARLLIGPDGGALELTAGLWELHVRITDNPETVVRHASSLWVY